MNSPTNNVSVNSLSTPHLSLIQDIFLVICLFSLKIWTLWLKKSQVGCNDVDLDLADDHVINTLQGSQLLSSVRHIHQDLS